MFTTIVGLAAASLTTLAFIPQAIKVVTTKSTKDISLLMFVVFCGGVFLWLTYGIMIKDIPLIVANSVTFILGIIILICKVKYK